LRYLSLPFIAKKELARTNQNPEKEWWREAPPLFFWIGYRTTKICDLEKDVILTG